MIPFHAQRKCIRVSQPRARWLRALGNELQKPQIRDASHTTCATSSLSVATCYASNPQRPRRTVAVLTKNTATFCGYWVTGMRMAMQRESEICDE